MVHAWRCRVGGRLVRRPVEDTVAVRDGKRTDDGRRSGEQLRADRDGGELREQAGRPRAAGCRAFGCGRAEPGDRARERVPQRRRNGQRSVGMLRHAAHRLAHPAARSHEQRLDDRTRHVERSCHLVVGKSIEVPQHDRLALARRQAGNGRLDLGKCLTTAGLVGGVSGRCGRLLDRARERRRHAAGDAGATFVSRDRRQPAGRVQRGRAAEERTVGREERLLGRVFGLVRIAQ